MSLSKAIMQKLFKDHATQLRVVLNTGTDDFINITTRRAINAGEDKLGRIVRFEDGTAIRITYEIIEEGEEG